MQVDTSGDTGPAAIAAVRGCENLDITVLYPYQRVSTRLFTGALHDCRLMLLSISLCMSYMLLM